VIPARWRTPPDRLQRLDAGAFACPIRRRDVSERRVCDPEPGPGGQNGGRMLTLKQKLILLVPLLVAVSAGVVLWFTNVQGTPTADDQIVEEYSPLMNSKVLQQAPITIDLQTGWDASLVVNGRTIPDDQLSKIPSQGRVTFQPGPGKEFEFLQAAQNCVNATYWPVRNPEQKFRKYWCFTAT
jgi:hypothetical protein